MSVCTILRIYFDTNIFWRNSDSPSQGYLQNVNNAIVFFIVRTLDQQHDASQNTDAAEQANEGQVQQQNPSDKVRYVEPLQESNNIIQVHHNDTTASPTLDIRLHEC